MVCKQDIKDSLAHNNEIDKIRTLLLTNILKCACHMFHILLDWMLHKIIKDCLKVSQTIHANMDVDVCLCRH